MPSPPLPLIVSIAYQGLSLFEMGIVAEVFGLSRPGILPPLYRFRVAQAEAGELRTTGGLRIRADGGLRLLQNARMVVVPGWRNHLERPPPALLQALCNAHERGARVMSICTGAFVLGATGLLNGKRATTHWQFADAFSRMFPKVELDRNVLYVDEGSVLTSAGSAAGVDACLHVVRQDYGVETANLVARTMVSSPHRSGGQAQYITQPVPVHENRGLAKVMRWATQYIADPITVPQLATRAAMSERTLLRRFLAEVGMTPKAWLTQERVRCAQRLLETSDASMEEISATCGFRSLETFRATFRRMTCVAPSVYRTNFRASAGPVGGSSMKPLRSA
jgi:AraC family transcriptional regulator, transcriptional activator FtrA